MLTTLPVGHIAENCTSDQRLCYNCRQPGHESSACPSPRTVAAKQCYSCGGVGHIQGAPLDLVCPKYSYISNHPSAECPSLRQQNNNQKCYVSLRLRSLRGHLLKSSPELRSIRSFRPQLHWKYGRICPSCPRCRTGFEHFDTTPCQMLSMRRTESYGQVCCCP